ncbi:hypothetical protein DL770_007748 [Monosporascus sp. CRB-9-2]|nr:hypothetical protein DL770_007748 [Monosporascus sp. CRB-9-2]
MASKVTGLVVTLPPELASRSDLRRGVPSTAIDESRVLDLMMRSLPEAHSGFSHATEETQGRSPGEEGTRVRKDWTDYDQGEGLGRRQKDNSLLFPPGPGSGSNPAIPEVSVPAVSTKGESIVQPEGSSFADHAAAVSGNGAIWVGAAYAERKAVAEVAHAAAAEHKAIAAELDEKLEFVLSMTSSMQSGTGASRGQSAALQSPSWPTIIVASSSYHRRPILRPGDVVPQNAATLLYRYMEEPPIAAATVFAAPSNMQPNRLMEKPKYTAHLDGAGTVPGLVSLVSPASTAGRIDGLSAHLFSVVWRARDAIATDTSADDAILTQLNRRKYSDVSRADFHWSVEDATLRA